MDTNNTWKKSDVVIPDVETNQEIDKTQAELLTTPIEGDVSGGLDGIGTPLKDVIPSTTKKTDVNVATAINLVELRGDKSHVEAFKLISKSQFDKDSMGSVETPSGLPIGLVYSLIGETEKMKNGLDLTSDKIIVSVNIKNKCKRCNGKGHIGRVFDNVTKEITDKLFKCNCLKTMIEVEKGQLKEISTQV